ncbi:MAG: diacylglycerol kinase family protein [Silvibacterium sp.]
MRHVAFFLNPLLTKHSRRRAIVDRCAALLRNTGCTVEMQDTVSACSAGEQARSAVESGFDTIFVCGGDGTFFQVLQGVAGSDAALGVIPLGTGNVLAQNLRMPRDPVIAFQEQLNAEAVSIPLGEVTCGGFDEASGGEGKRSWYFTIAAGMGIHAALMNLAQNGSGKRLWGRAAYYAGGLRLLFKHPIQVFDVELTGADGEVRSFRTSELLSVRVPAINRWRPGGDLCSPEFRVATVPQSSRLGLAHASFHALVTRKSNGGSRLPYPHYEGATKVVCKPAAGILYRAPLLVEADGEVIGVEQATFSMAQQRLRLLWPNRAG